MTKIAEFEVSSTGIIDPSGKPVSELPPFARDANELKSLYRAMVLTRAFDAKAIALQRTGRLGTYRLLAWSGSRQCRRCVTGVRKREMPFISKLINFLMAKRTKAIKGERGSKTASCPWGIAVKCFEISKAIMASSPRERGSVMSVIGTELECAPDGGQLQAAVLTGCRAWRSSYCAGLR